MLPTPTDPSETSERLLPMICANHSKAGSDWCSIGQLSQRYGISQPTIRTMCDEGLEHFVTIGKHRRISDKTFRLYIGLDKPADATLPRVCIVCRVSTPSQARPRTDGPDAQSDLDRQVDRCRKYVKDRWGNECVLTENIRVASGLNFNSKELIDFTLALVRGEYDYVVISYKDRLARSSYELFLNLGKQSGTEFICIEQKDDPTFTESLVEDLIALCTVAACKHNSAKSAKHSTIHVEQEALVTIYQQYRQGMSYADLSKYCEANGIFGIKDSEPQKLSPAKLCQLLNRHQKVLEKLVPESGNHIQDFIGACLVKQDGTFTKQVDIYATYQEWCKKHSVACVSAKKLGLQLKQAGFASDRKFEGMKVFRGIALR